MTRLGVVGHSSANFDQARAREILEEEIGRRAALDPELSVVSGLTALGVPLIAYQVAASLGLTTVGIACAKANEYECWPCDEIVIEGEEWGAESDLFLASIDELLKVGGGKQSGAEFARFEGPKVEFPL